MLSYSLQLYFEVLLVFDVKVILSVAFIKCAARISTKKTPINLKLVQKYTYGWRLHHWNGLYFVGIFIHSYKAVSLLAKCNLKQYDGHRGAASFRQTGNLSSEKLALAQWALLAGRRLFFFDEYIMCLSKTDKLTLMVGVALPGRDLPSRSLGVPLSPETGGWSCSWCLSSWREGG